MNPGGSPQNPAQQFNQNQMQGIATGPLLAQKVVQLPKQQRANNQSPVPAGSAANNPDISDEQKMFRNGKIKLDRLKKE